VHDDLVRRDFTADAPNVKWLTDITEHCIREAEPAFTAVPAHPRRIADAGRVRKKSSVLVRERHTVKSAAIADWADTEDYPIDFTCRELGVSRSGYYAWRGRVPSDHDQADKRLLTLIRTAHARLRGNPGVRRIHAELTALGHRLSRKRVWRLMRTADLQGRHPKG
jgi:helix-turn-helix protein